MSELKLKPCPFCGGKGIVNNGEYNLESFVKCSTCGAETSRVVESTKYCSDEKAIEAWNRRDDSENIPSADAALVRCKDCRYYVDYNDVDYYCEMLGCDVPSENFYCRDAVEKELD